MKRNPGSRYPDVPPLYMRVAFKKGWSLDELMDTYLDEINIWALHLLEYGTDDWEGSKQKEGPTASTQAQWEAEYNRVLKEQNLDDDEDD